MVLEPTKNVAFQFGKIQKSIDAKKVCVSERFSLIRRRKKSVQLSPQETTHPTFQSHQIVQFHVKEIVHFLKEI